MKIFEVQSTYITIKKLSTIIIIIIKYIDYSGTSNRKRRHDNYKQPLYKGHSSMSQMLIFLIHFNFHTFLTSEQQTTSLQRTKWLALTCPLFRGSAVHVSWQWPTCTMEQLPIIIVLIVQYNIHVAINGQDRYTHLITAKWNGLPTTLENWT